jgi:hypothetical protein
MSPVSQALRAVGVRSVALLTLTAVLGAACTANPTSEAESPPASQIWVILDADSHGVVLLGARSGAPDVLRGVDRAGNPSWERNDLAASLPSVVCRVQCPAAVASSGTVTGVDLAMTMLGQTTAAAPALDPNASVLSALGDAAVQETRSSDTAVTLALTSSSAREDLTISGVRTTWRASNDNRTAMALVGDATGSTYAVRTFHRGATWEPTAWAGKSNTLFGCTGAGGRQIVVSDPQPALIDLQTGKRVPIGGLESGGDCAFTSDSAVVAQYELRDTVHHSVLVTTDLTGAVSWRQEYDSEVPIRADLGGQGFLTLPPGKMQERDSRGALLQSVDDVGDARYDEAGDIVLVNSSGNVRWIPGRSRAITK